MDPRGAQQERWDSTSANTCLPLADKMNVVHEARLVYPELPHILRANPCFGMLAGVLYFTNTLIQLKSQFLKTAMSLPAHTCTAWARVVSRGNMQAPGDSRVTGRELGPQALPGRSPEEECCAS